MNGGEELVSIIIPTYYRNDLLPRAMESALAQTYDPVEVLVVDDSGEAHAEPVVAAYEEVEYVPLEKNSGVQAARYAGLDRSDGTYVEFLDDDDRLRAEKLARQVPLFDDEVGVVYAGLEWDDPDRDPQYPIPEVRGDVLRHALAMDLFPCCDPTMLVRRDVLEEIPPERHNHSAVDVGLMIDLARRTKFAYVSEPLVTCGLEGGLTRSLDYVDARWRVLETFDDLYDEHPPAVKHAAISSTYEWEGEIRFAENRRSAGAALSFLRSAYHSPEPHVKKWPRSLAWIVGRAGARS